MRNRETLVIPWLEALIERVKRGESVFRNCERIWETERGEFALRRVF